MSETRRLRFAPAINAGAVTLCASLIVLGLAVHVIGRFRGQAEEARQAHVLLEQVNGHMHELDSLEWKATALGRLSSTLERQIMSTRSEIWAAMEDLEATNMGDVGAIEDVFWTYVLAEDEELRALETGEITAARAADEERHDPSFERLHDLITEQNSASAATVRKANDIAGTGVTVTVLLSALAIAFLYRSFRSVTHDKELEEGRRKVLQDSESRFRSLVQNSADVIGIIDETATLTYVSSTVKRVMGYDPTELIGSNGFAYIHPDDIEAGQDTLMKIVSDPDSPMEVELRMLHKDGSWRWTEVSGRNLLDDPQIKGVLINYRDITEKKALQEQLRDLAFSDSLTGLANRSLFVDRVDHALARRERTSVPMTVLFLDVDDFKTINDSLGHGCGDDLLSEVASRLSTCLRPEDTIARLGGDEFAILLEDADVDDAGKVARRIFECIRKPVVLEGRATIVTISIGIAEASTSQDSDQLLRNADVAMYMAKGLGKARFEVFRPSMHEAVMKRLELKGDLQRALDQGEFYVDYQPTVDLSTGEISGVEALARWTHPKHGFVSPAEFIPLAEESGIILPLGHWVLHEACSQLRRWRDAHPDKHDLSVAVNISARQLASETLMHEISEVLSETLLPPQNLTLEVTESFMMEDAEATIETFQRLKSLGVRIAIDDFGTGYSALSYLRRFPVDVLKIDKEFVDEVTGGVEQSALVQAIIRLGASFGLETVAEGIENAEQVSSLQTLRCHVGQGSFLARPTTPEKIDELLAHGETLRDKVTAGTETVSV